MSDGNVYIGTSGWSYDHWKGTFYPEGVKKRDFLSCYAERLSSVEVNNTFYSMPSEKTLASWKKTVSRDFVFAVKASRYLTHMKKLKSPEDALAAFLNGISSLSARTHVVLFQLPPRWKPDVDRLRDFLYLLPDTYRYAFEFRDERWFTDTVYSLLNKKNAAFCIYDIDRRQSPREVTADFIYIRLHGPEDKYQGLYNKEDLEEWVGAINTWTQNGHDVYCYFDNDQNGYAVRNAIELSSLIQAGRST